MSRRDAPEFSWIESLGRYRKRIKDPLTKKYISVYGRTKQELREKVRAKEAELSSARRSAEDPYVYEYAATWYKLNTVGLSESRKQDYRGAINKHICPEIGNMLVRDVKPDDVKRVMAEAAEMSKSSQQKIVTTLRRIFESAEENGLIDRTPCRNIKAAGAPPAEKVPLTDQQCEILIDAVKGTRAYLFVLIGLYAGLRREEICALQWDCVHLEAEVPYIAVRRAVRWEKNNKPVVSEKLKSAKAKRDIPIAPPLLGPLKEAKSAADSDYVIPDTQGGVMSYTSFIRLWGVIGSRSTGTVTRKGKDGKPHTRGKKLGDKVARHDLYITIDFPVTPHQLRHTFITNLILSGANIKTVQYLAGHATTKMTLDIYTHLMENRPEDTLSAITTAYGAPKGASDLTPKLTPSAQINPKI